MKKNLMTLAAFALMISLMACGNSGESQSQAVEEVSSEMTVDFDDVAETTEEDMEEADAEEMASPAADAPTVAPANKAASSTAAGADMGAVTETKTVKVDTKTDKAKLSGSSSQSIGGSMDAGATLDPNATEKPKTSSGND
ncbi:MAG: hypothetical protein ACK417_08365 [Bacteroidia bacterium]